MDAPTEPNPWFTNGSTQPDITATALVRDGVPMDYHALEDGSAGVVLIGLADRQLKVIATADTFRELVTTVSALLTELGRMEGS